MARAYWRLLKAYVAFLPIVWTFLRDRKRFVFFGGGREVTYDGRRRRAERFKETLVDLGPTYIKLGQLLSTRPDLMPQAYLDELIELQDDVPPDDFEEIARIVEEDLGRHPDEIFDDFEREAISGASLGQVHVAYYRGDKVAVKVRRPGVEELVNADLRVMNFFLPIAKRVMERIEPAHAESMEGFAGEFEERIGQEMNYYREKEMLDEIRGNFRGDDRVVIPRSYDDVSTRRVLTLEYVGGIKITDVEKLRRMGFDPHRIAVDLDKLYLEMTLIDGVFHGDPHPGNLAVDERGRIVIYDFGMSGRLSPSLQRAFIEFFQAAANRDPDAMMEGMMEMGVLDRDVDRELMRDVLEVAIQDLSGESVDEMQLDHIMEQIDETVYEYPLRIPQHVALGLRVSTIVEGVCAELDPGFDFLAVAKEFFIEQGYVQQEIRGRMVQAWDDVQDTVESIARTPSKLETSLDKVTRDELEVTMDVEDTHDHIRLLSKRLTYAIVAGSAIVGGSIMAVAQPRYVAPMFGFALVVLWLVRRSFKRRTGIAVGPTHYATRHQAEKKQQRSRDERRDEEAATAIERPDDELDEVELR